MTLTAPGRIDAPQNVHGHRTYPAYLRYRNLGTLLPRNNADRGWVDVDDLFLGLENCVYGKYDTPVFDTQLAPRYMLICRKEDGLTLYPKSTLHRIKHRTTLPMDCVLINRVEWSRTDFDGMDITEPSLMAEPPMDVYDSRF